MNHEYESRKKTALCDYFSDKRRTLKTVLGSETHTGMNGSDFRVYYAISAAMNEMSLSYQQGKVSSEVYRIKESDRFFAAYRNERTGEIVRITNKNAHCYIYQLQHADGSREEFLLDIYAHTYRTIPRHMPVPKTEKQKEPGLVQTLTKAAGRIADTLVLAAKQVLNGGETPQTAN